MKMKILWSVLLPISLFAIPFFANAATDAPGTNVLTNGTIYMVTADGQLRPYTSAGAFLSYGFNSWSDVVQASSNDMALPVGSFIPPRDGSIICSNGGSDKGTCYLITNGQKAAFTSEAVFNASGFNFKYALYGDVSFLPATSSISNATQAHLPGTLINNNGTVEIVGTNGTIGVPSMNVLQSWGYSLIDVVQADTADQTFTQSAILTMHTPGQLAYSDTVNTPTAPTSTTTPSPISTPAPVATPQPTPNPIITTKPVIINSGFTTDTITNQGFVYTDQNGKTQDFSQQGVAVITNVPTTLTLEFINPAMDSKLTDSDWQSNNNTAYRDTTLQQEATANPQDVLTYTDSLTTDHVIPYSSIPGFQPNITYYVWSPLVTDALGNTFQQLYDNGDFSDGTVASQTTWNVGDTADWVNSNPVGTNPSAPVITKDSYTVQQGVSAGSLEIISNSDNDDTIKNINITVNNANADSILHVSFSNGNSSTIDPIPTGSFSLPTGELINGNQTFGINFYLSNNSPNATISIDGMNTELGYPTVGLPVIITPNNY